MMALAHKLTREDMAFNPSLPEIMRKSYAYYFRLHMLNLHAIEREKRTGVCYGFQIVEPKRLWA